MESSIAIISLPHEIQRNLTMIREHDSEVQDVEKDMFKDINEFMSLQSKEKEIPSETRIELIKRIKNSFLNTLTHCEEKVSLANQCYNSVEKHLVKMEEDLKCFEEEIRLSGYAELLEKVRIERHRQKQQIRNKKRLEAAEIEDESENEEEGGEEGDENGGESSNSENSSAEQQATVQQKKRKPAPANSRTSATTVKKQRSVSSRTAATKPLPTENESDDDAQAALKISRAERLLRRNKPNFVEETRAVNEETAGKEDALENEGDDEAESYGSDAEGAMSQDGDEEGEGEEDGKDEVSESEDPDTEGDEPTDNTATTLLTESPASVAHSSGASSGDDSRASRKPQPQQPTKSNTTSLSPSDPLYCTCHRVSYGQMIACDAKDCPVEWFHIACVGLKSLPKGKWYCRGCQEGMDARTAAQMASGMSTRSSRR